MYTVCTHALQVARHRDLHAAEYDSALSNHITRCRHTLFSRRTLDKSCVHSVNTRAASRTASWFVRGLVRHYAGWRRERASGAFGARVGTLARAYETAAMTGGRETKHDRMKHRLPGCFKKSGRRGVRGRTARMPAARIARAAGMGDEGGCGGGCYFWRMETTFARCSRRALSRAVSPLRSRALRSAPASSRACTASA